jgi:hypothetical protein
MGMEVFKDGKHDQQKSPKKEITARQKEYLEAYRKAGSAAKAALLLGVSVDSAERALQKVAHAYGYSSIRKLIDKSAECNSRAEKKEIAKGLMRLIKSQEYRCALSGEKLTPNTAELDHIKPRSKGGSDELQNLQWLDRRINRMKGQMKNDEFIAVCRRVVEWTR